MATAKSAPSRKYYIPLESDPEIFTELIHRLGVDPRFTIQDVFSLDDEAMIAMTPRPVFALIFTLFMTDKYHVWRDENEKNRPVYNGHGDSEQVVWFEQTIRNACGFYGILHSVSNGPARDHILPNTALDNLLTKAIPLDRDARALALEDSQEIEEAYKVAALKGGTAPPAVGEEVDYHYIAFVPNKENNKIYLMDGTRKGPVDTGVTLAPGEDFLPKALGIVKDAISHIDGGVRFNLLALAQSPEWRPDPGLSATMTTAKSTPHRKTYIPLESDPEIFTDLIHELGVKSELSLYDVYSLDDEALTAMVPRPVLALIFNLYETDQYKAWRDEDEKKRPVYNGHGDSEQVIWFEQTIHNACGFYGILHCISNGPARDHIRPNTALDNFIAKAIPLNRDARALALEDSKEIEEAYEVAALKGGTAPPAIGEKVDYHYIAFVPNKENNKIYLMDGCRKGPVDTGVTLASGEDFLPKALGIVKDTVSHIDGGVRFNLMALAQAPKAG